MGSNELEAIKRILQRERVARKEAEKLLEEKSRELYDTNEKLKGFATELEGRVNKRTQELATQNNLLTSIFGSIKAGILSEDIGNDNVLVNQYMCDLFSLKLSAKEANQLNVEEFSQLINGKILNQSAFALSTLQILSNRVPTSEEEWLLKDGRYVSRLFIPLKIGSKYQGPFWMYTDVSYSKELESSRAAAQAGTEAKSIFLANMSHEIRTPLNGIIGMNRLLIEDGLKPRQMDFAMSVNESAQSLLQIINDILDFSKIEADRLDLEIVPFSIIDMVDSVFELLQVKSNNKGLNFNVIYDPQIPPVLSGDPSRLKQVLLNLLDNAIKFTHEGSVTLRVQAYSATDDTCIVKFLVEDTGIGMGKQDLFDLFKPFSQADATISRRFGGTGLGLAISRRILHMMDGDIEVSSEKSKGTIFTATAKFPIDESSDKKPTVLSDTPSFAIIITAANSEQKQSLSSMVGLEGCSPISTSNVSEALEILDKSNNDRTLWVVSCDKMDPKDQANLRGIIQTISPKCTPIFLLRNDKQAEQLYLTQYSTIHMPINRKNLLRRIGNAMDVGTLPHIQLEGNDDETISSLNLKQIRVLLAEDNSINQQMGRITLERMGAKIDVAANGLEAIQMHNKISYDVIIMDIHMPEMDGVEACKRIRGAGSDIPIIALTANAMKGDKERFLDAGMDEYLSKPLIHTDLIKIFQKLFSEGSEESFKEKRPTEDLSAKSIIDYEAFLATIGGDVEIAKDVMNTFCLQKEEILQTLEDAQESQDWKKARANVHRLCGSSYSIHAHEIAQAASEMEALLDESPNHSTALEESIEQLKIALCRFDKCLQNISF
ncbi:ATP-binding protein [Puniceicoccaceae bacterium K14]|nr:ATP-binding protein [Puniceicoccaceae bacterium K14]